MNINMNKNRKKEISNSRASSTVPEGFSLAMAIVDCLPVLFFSISSAILAMRFDSILFRIGVTLVIIAGALKAGWKFVIALVHKDVPFLSRQMGFLMPAGFLLVLIALMVDHRKWSFGAVAGHMVHMPALIFFLCGAAGLMIMTWLARSQDRRNAKANWIEQIVNSLSQFCIMMGIFL